MKPLIATGLFLAIFAAPALADHDHGAMGTASGAPPLFEGLGPIHHKVTTSSSLAQKYFDQGLRLTFAFNHDEAGRSFREAARIDSNCAMAYWGAALVLGPNINMPMSPEAEETAYATLRQAQAHATGASPEELAYIEALSKRYDAVPGANRAEHDSAYADAMRGLMKQYPEDNDAATLCAESLMDLRPWDLWTLDGKPQPGTMEILSILEGVLKRDSNHPGAIHYYVHSVEASPEPGRAESVANKLPKLTPNAGHLVHMPSHIYLRIGLYNESAALNARAAAVDRAYITKYHPSGIYPMMYYPHNIHMGWSSLCSAGRRADAVAAANELREVVTDSVIRLMPMAEYFRPSFYLTYPRFGLWEETLKLPPPPADFRISTAFWEYARGMALAATGQAAEATVARDSIAAIAASMPGEESFGANPVAPVLRFAAALLTGEISARSGKTDEAIRELTIAAGMQDSLRYDEPPPWNATARQSLGAVLLLAGRPAEAEAVYREDLARYPENGWSLYGLTQSLRAQKKTREANDAEKRFQKAWSEADAQLTSSRY
jgi:tetratricopeptide (TPR) repeat protein